MPRHSKILVVDDERRQREILELILNEEGYCVASAASGEQALKMIRQERYDLVLTDLKMVGMDGIKLLQHLLQIDSSIIVILMTAHGSIDSAKEAIRLGAYDYLEKPLDREKLLEVIKVALGRLRKLDTAIIGESAEIQKIKKIILKIAASDETVLIRGESGVGKELVARAIHENSRRASANFCAVNCAAINENLLESELFGHEKGAFTGAHTDKKGLFEAAANGTLFLDEIGDMSISMQAKILRALQEREILRVGSTRPTKIDVRLIAATNRDLEAMVKENSFRSDLYYRLNVIPIHLPPLRSRKEDIPILIDYFLARQPAAAKIKGLTPAAQKLLINYSWPGNVRQLESAIKRAVLLCEAEYIDVEDLPIEIRQAGSGSTTSSFGKLPPEGISFEDLERSLILQAMEQADWNITRAAKLLGLTFRTLQYRLEKFDIKKQK
ncbi:MAG: sigma-54 dependent transcriptional regulator [Acidobacteriota bacterium]|nr:sigma-54 dependent transcriptional regulator [Blastocatellia bacterium]MDW8412348.1 sigma-54 dependent transcriptional regulator [Acidobacteriota bacterium]